LAKVDVKKTEDAKTYLTLPGSWAEVEEKERQTGKTFQHSGVIPVTKDSFQIGTLTCSTKLTQNGTVVRHDYLGINVFRIKQTLTNVIKSNTTLSALRLIIQRRMMLT
jgi:hypothetical protein